MSHPNLFNLDPAPRPALVSPAAVQGDRATPCAHASSYPSVYEDINLLLNDTTPGSELHSPAPHNCNRWDVIAPATMLATTLASTGVQTDNTPTVAGRDVRSFAISSVGAIAQAVDPANQALRSDSSCESVSIFAAESAAAVPPGNGSSRVLVLGAADDNATTDELAIGVAVSYAGNCIAPASVTRRALPQEQVDLATSIDTPPPRPQALLSLDVAPVEHPAVAPHASAYSPEEVVDYSTNVHNNAAPLAERAARVVVASHRSGSFPLNSCTANVPRLEAESAGHPTAAHRIANRETALFSIDSAVPGVTSTPTAADGTSLVSQAVEHVARADEYTVINALLSHNIVDHDNLSASQVTLAGAGVVGTTVSETTVAAPLPGQPTAHVEPWQGYMIFDAFPYDEGGPRVPFDRDELPTDLAYFH